MQTCAFGAFQQSRITANYQVYRHSLGSDYPNCVVKSLSARSYSRGAFLRKGKYRSKIEEFISSFCVSERFT